MTALTKDTNRVYEFGNINELPVAAGEVIYQGAALSCNSSGYVKGITDGDTFAGFAEENCNNVAGSDGAKNVRIRKKGSILLEISGITLADVNKSVYATEDNTFTLSSTSAVYIGQISRIDASGLALVEFASDKIPPAIV
jgi:hypothetical protein